MRLFPILVRLLDARFSPEISVLWLLLGCAVGGGRQRCFELTDLLLQDGDSLLLPLRIRRQNGVLRTGAPRHRRGKPPAIRLRPILTRVQQSAGSDGNQQRPMTRCWCRFAGGNADRGRCTA